MGLIDTKTLQYDAPRSGVKDDKSGSGRPQVGGKSGPGRGDENRVNGSEYKHLEKNNDDNAEKVLLPIKTKTHRNVVIDI